MFAAKKLSLAGEITPARLFTAAILIFIAATRWLLAPRFLYYFDSANFALALEHFNPAMHEPQPPGYPLFVALTRIIHLLIGEPERVLLIAGLVAAFAATLVIRVLASDLFGRAAGILAMALLASNPVFWFGGITNQIRVFLALCSLTVALLAWRALTRPGAAWLYATFAALGVAAGFRPFAALLLSPVCLWAWMRRGISPRQGALALGALLATMLPWAAVTIVTLGGPRRAVEIFWGYANSQFQDTSALFGAEPHAAYGMFLNALVWNFLGAVIWLWAVPWVVRRPDSAAARTKAALLALVFLPTFLFSGFVHIGDPDQALASVAILSTIGGGVLAAKFRVEGAGFSWNRVLSISTAAIAVHALIFFFPPTRIARAASYKAAAAVDRMTAAAITSVEVLSHKGPVTIVHYGSPVASRQLMYYFPEDYVVVLPGRPGAAAPGEQPHIFYRHQPLTAPPGKGLILRGSQRILYLLPPGVSPARPGWHRYGPIFFQSPVPQGPLQIGPYPFEVDAR